MENKSPKFNKIDEAMHNFEKAKISIAKAIENLNSTLKNLDTTKKHFNSYNVNKRMDYLNVITRFGIPSLDEKSKLLEDLFTPCVIEDESNKKIIIIDEKKIKNSL